MESRFQLRCLGEPVLLGPDGQPVRFKVRKHLALLVYLAVESGVRHRREHLAELLWPNLPDAEGRHSLATGLSTLRARFGRDVVEAGRDDLRWSHARLDMDLDRLAAGEVLGDEYTTPLDVAGFLDGFEVPGAAEFMLWRERQRARWLPLVRDALVVLMDRCRRTGDSRQIEQLADRMLRLDDLSEEAVRAKMEARAFAGDRLSALKIFEAWKERLEEELGASPSTLLEGMALRLRRRGWERSGASEIPSVRTDQWKNRPFVGRANEYRMLYEGWERAQRGGAGHALVIGESGIGKTTLVERLTTAAGLEGASVARVQCYELEREIPYAAVCGLVRALLARPGASGTSAHALGELSRVVPEVTLQFSGVPTPKGGDGETTRVGLADALHELVVAIAEESPVILVLDNQHLADTASLGLLHLLARRVENQAVMFILIAQPGESGRSTQAARLQELLSRLGAPIVDLPTLPDGECQELLSSLLPSDIPQPNAAARRALINAARGFPMALELLCQDWSAHGERSLALSLEAMTFDAATPTAPTEAYRLLYARIVESLEPLYHNVLNLAAILGNRLNELGMYSLADLSPAQAMQGLTRLVSLRMLRDGTNGLEFVTELARAHAYVNVPSTVRRTLHGGIADRLIERDKQGVELEGLEVAWHCIRSGRATEATPYLLRGARQAIQSGAPQEAERALSSGLEILDSEAREEGLLLLAEAFQEQGAWSESLSTLERADSGLRSRHHSRIFTMTALGRFETGMIGSENAHETLAELCRLASTSTPTTSSSLALRTACRIAYGSRLDGAISLLLDIAEQYHVDSENDAANLDLRYVTALLRAYRGDKGGSAAALHDAKGLIERYGIDSAIAGYVYVGIGALHCGAGEYESAAENFIHAYFAAQRRGSDDAMALAAGNYSLCLARLGRTSEQVEWASKGLAAQGARFVGYRSIQLQAYYAHGLARLGKSNEAVAAIDRFERSMPTQVVPWLAQVWQLQKADILTFAGRNGPAKAEARKGISGDHLCLHASSTAGPFARWVAVASDAGEAVQAFKRIDALFRELVTYDAIDQIEILGARKLLRARFPRVAPIGDSDGENEKLREGALRLPMPALSQLRALGLPI